MHSLKPKKKVALVTGGTGSIGFAVCKLLSQKGIDVVLSGRNIERVSESLDKLGPEVTNLDGLELDVTSTDSIKRAKNYLIDKYGRIDILINNSAVYLDNRVNGIYPSIFSLPKEMIDSTLNVNVCGPFLLSQAILPEMITHNYGRIVNVSSGMGRFDNLDSNAPLYRISKTALNSLTCIFAHAAGSSDICVNAVCPGWVRSQMGGVNAVRSPEEGAEGIVWAATLPSGSPTGRFFRDSQPLDWCHMLGDPY